MIAKFNDLGDSTRCLEVERSDNRVTITAIDGNDFSITTEISRQDAGELVKYLRPEYALPRTAELKTHMVNLLVSDFKKGVVLERFEDDGHTGLYGVNNNDTLNVILDMVGFPTDNSMEYQITNRIAEAGFFTRFWLVSRWSTITEKHLANVPIDVDHTEGNLMATTPSNENRIRAEVEQYIEWIHREYDEWEKDTYHYEPIRQTREHLLSRSKALI